MSVESLVLLQRLGAGPLFCLYSYWSPLELEDHDTPDLEDLTEPELEHKFPVLELSEAKIDKHGVIEHGHRFVNEVYNGEFRIGETWISRVSLVIETDPTGAPLVHIRGNISIPGGYYRSVNSAVPESGFACAMMRAKTQSDLLNRLVKLAIGSHGPDTIDDLGRIDDLSFGGYVNQAANRAEDEDFEVVVGPFAKIRQVMQAAARKVGVRS